jgi:hypothetical protein
MAMSIDGWQKTTPASSRAIIIAAVFSLIGAAHALAADIGVPTAPPPSVSANYFPRPVDWGGLYFGVNGGYAFRTSVWTNGALSTGNFSANGGLAGGTLGINYANGGGFLFGVELDADWSGVLGSSSIAACTALGALPAGTACRTKSDWLSTGRVRLDTRLTASLSLAQPAQQSETLKLASIHREVSADSHYSLGGPLAAD